jgi:hypothetical protein
MVTGASGPGISIRASQKFTASTSASQSQVRPGGIFGSQVAFSAPGPGGAGGVRLAGAVSLLPSFSCPTSLMIISSGGRPAHLTATIAWA